MREPDYSILAKLRPATSKNVNRVSLVGQKFNRFTVYSLVGFAQTKQAMSYWLCRCDCGNFRFVAKGKLVSGRTKSCGCHRNEVTGNRSRTHGLSKTLIYRRWSDMHTRCYNEKFKHFYNYGGRGIKVEERWHNFENFYADMGDPPDPSYQIERRDNNGNYGPDNCQWATKKQQARNKRNNTYLTYNGETHCVSEWAEITGLSQLLIAKRKRKGWPDDECLGFAHRASADRYRRKE